MRLWHQSLIPYLDRQHLLGQHRECCALRGKGWGRKHTTVDYVFKYNKDRLFAYHMLVLREMERRGYKYDKQWADNRYNGKNLSLSNCKKVSVPDIMYLIDNYHIIQYPLDHGYQYLVGCVNLLKQKNAPMDFDKIEKELGVK